MLTSRRRRRAELHQPHAGSEFANLAALDQTAPSSRAVLAVDLHLFFRTRDEERQVVRRNLIYSVPAHHDVRELALLVHVLVDRHCPSSDYISIAAYGS